MAAARTRAALADPSAGALAPVMVRFARGAGIAAAVVGLGFAVTIPAAAATKVTTPAIAGVVFNDRDLDGKRDAGETVRSGVTVELLVIRRGTATKVRSATSKPRTGRFSLTIKANGTYRARMKVPKGFLAVRTSQSRSVTVTRTKRKGLTVNFALRPAPPVTTTPNPTPITAPGPVVLPTPTPAPVPLKTVSGRVWSDVDGDGLLDPGEAGLAAVVVQLFSADKTTELGTTTTGGDGAYTLSVPAGTTFVRAKLTPAAGTLLSGSSSGTVPTTDSDFAVFGADKGFTAVLDAAADVTGVDGALGTAGSIRGRLFRDEDADGRFDGADTIIAGTVELWSRFGERLLATAASLVPTGYRFDVAAGASSGYRIRFVKPDEGRHTLKNIGPVTSDSDAVYSGAFRGFSDVIFPPNPSPNVTSVDSGFQRPINLTGIKVFYDDDGDGLLGATGAFSSAAMIQLWDAAKFELHDTTPILESGATLTAPGPGLYRVKFPQLSGNFTLKDAGNDALDSDANRSGLDKGFTDPVQLVAGLPGPSNIDAGIYRTHAIGELVFRDANSNGRRDAGEPGVAGAIMQLLEAVSGDVVVEDVTGADGVYILDAPEPGSYRVRIVPPPGDALTAQNAAGSTESNDSDFSTVSRLTATIVAPAGGANLDVDAGLLP